MKTKQEKESDRMKTKEKVKVREKVKEIKQEIKKEVLFNVPNSLTLLRLILTFVIVYMLFSGYSRVSITVIFVVAALTDTLDGFLARRLKQTTKIGARLDQVIDRIFGVMVVLSLGAYFLIYTHEEIIILFLILSREIIGAPGVFIRVIRNMDTYKVKYIGKATTFVQCFAIGAVILGVSWAIYLAVLTCLLGIVSGFDYLRDSLI